MATYNIIESFTSTENYQVVVMATSYEDPLDTINTIKNIEFELRSMEISKGVVVFDLLTCVGNSSQRFITLYFNGFEFDLNSYEIITVPKKSELRQSMASFFNKLGKELEYTVLNSIQIRLIRSGVAI